VRIIAGKYRSRIIKMPKTTAIRPTKDRIRESLFGILGESVKGKIVLDLFAGSGAFGMEALSRGAKLAIFVEGHARCISAIKENLTALEIETEAYRVLRADVFRAMAALENKKEKFDLVLLDPPYNKDLAKKCLLVINRHDILYPHCIIVAEHHKDDTLPGEVNNIINYRRVCYGEVCLSFFKLKA